MNRTSTQRAALAAALLACSSLAHAAGVEGPSLSMIPAVHGPLSILRFHAQPTGQGFVRESLGSSAVQAAETTSGPLTKFMAGTRLAAYATQDGADSEIFADLNHLPAGRMAASSAASAAGTVFARPDVLPHDATTVALANPSTLFGGTSKGGAGQALMTYVAANRMVDGMPVLGTGSRASVGIGNDGAVHAFVKHWRAADRAETVAPTLSKADVQAAIVKQLAHFETPTAHVKVDRVGLGYYDGNGSAIQPVYHFTARILPRGAAARALHDGDAVVGYVPVGATVEPIPDLSGTASHGPSGGASQNSITPDGWGTGETLGAYVVRNDDANWVNSANAFAGALAGTGLARTQYYWAYPYEFTSSANSYINSVNVADTEVHGDWWLFTTYQNWGDLVYLSQIGSGGNPSYGGWGQFGRLAHWWIHSCEVIPSMFDEAVATGNAQNAFNVWWNIFQGMHQAVGYRTIMFIGDGAAGPYGADLAAGGGMTTSWLNSVSSLSLYNQGWTYLSYHLNRQVPYGKPSVISIPGLQDDSVFASWAAQPGRNVGFYNYWFQGAVD